MPCQGRCCSCHMGPCLCFPCPWCHYMCLRAVILPTSQVQSKVAGVHPLLLSKGNKPDQTGNPASLSLSTYLLFSCTHPPVPYCSMERPVGILVWGDQTWLDAWPVDSGGTRTKPGYNLLVRQSLLCTIPLCGSFKTLSHPCFIPAMCPCSRGWFSAAQRALVK